MDGKPDLRKDKELGGKQGTRKEKKKDTMKDTNMDMTHVGG
jgi:hypothetical protein